MITDSTQRKHIAGLENPLLQRCATILKNTLLVLMSWKPVHTYICGFQTVDFPRLVDQPGETTPMAIARVIESLWSCMPVYVKKKRPRIDVIGAQIQTSYRRFV